MACDLQKPKWKERKEVIILYRSVCHFVFEIVNSWICPGDRLRISVRILLLFNSLKGI